jgi:hypothetical protein
MLARDQERDQRAFGDREEEEERVIEAEADSSAMDRPASKFMRILTHAPGFHEGPEFGLSVYIALGGQFGESAEMPRPTEAPIHAGVTSQTWNQPESRRFLENRSTHRGRQSDTARAWRRSHLVRRWMIRSRARSNARSDDLGAVEGTGRSCSLV